MTEQYDDEIGEDEFNAVIDRCTTAEQKNVKLTQAINSFEQDKKEGNFLHHQIDTSAMIKNLERFYRGDFQDYDDNQELVWKKQTNTDLVTFNDFGVSSMMEIISKYVDKNTILSDYREERIYEIIGDIGDELILLILCNYEMMGMNTHFKKTKFRIMITTTAHIIESAYRRAKDGKTLKEINQSRVIGQFGDAHSNQQSRTPMKKESWFQRFIN